jgi:hypothetical protein
MGGSRRDERKSRKGSASVHSDDDRPPRPRDWGISDEVMMGLE